MKRFAALFAILLFPALGVNAKEQILTLAPGTNTEDAIRAVENIGGRYLRSLELINAVVMDLPETKTEEVLSTPGIARVEDDPYIQWVIEPARASFPFMPPAGKGSPASREIPWGVGEVRAPAAWSATEGAGVKIAVLDSGINSKHPDLADNYAGGYNALDPEKLPADDNGHGTLVAGIIAAARNAKGVAGVAPKASLYAVKVLDKRNSGKLSAIIAGLQWAVANRMDIVNMSFGSKTGTPAFQNAVNAAVRSGLTLVCATGNESGPVNYPAKYEAAIAVTASDIRGDILDVASTGPEVDFIAPGVDIRTTSKGGGYSNDASGTSFAAPHVTGVAALAIGLGIKGTSEIRAALSRSARDMRLSPQQQGAGQVDAGKLLKLFPQPSPINR